MGRKPKAKAIVEPTSTLTGTNLPLEMMETKQQMGNPESIPAKKIDTNNVGLLVRRSGRHRNSSFQVPQNQRVVDKIDIVDNDGHNEPRVEELSNELNEPHVEELSTEPILRQRNLEETLDFLVHSVKEFKSLVTKRTFPSEPEFAEPDYKSLYIDSQKKIDSLLHENHEVAKKLEFARGKIEAYEQMKDAFGFKETTIASDLAKLTEAVLNFTSQAGSASDLPVVVASPAAANGEEAKASPEKNIRTRKKSRC